MRMALRVYQSLWVFAPDEERAQFEAFIDPVMECLERWPDTHIYHSTAYQTLPR